MNYRFGGFELQPRERRLLMAGEPVALGSRAFDVLLALVERAGQLVTKDELLEVVWSKLVVEEGNLQVQISTLRKAIGAEAIATVTGKGYRFTLHVECVAADSSSSGDNRRHNLPQQVTSFIGRHSESAELKQLLTKTRLLTLVGAGGVGKTRQALHVATEVIPDHADGVWFVDLAPIVDEELVPLTVASVLGVDLGNAKVPEVALVRRLNNRQLLLLLDNCEHVIAGAANLVEALLAWTSKVSVLATSREPLSIAGEQVFRLPSLGLTEDHPLRAEEALTSAAVELFVDRAKAADAHFAMDDHNANSIAAICRWLDGIPLALEMAAARVSALGVGELELKLKESFRLLTGGRRIAVPRHQTLRATLDWSYALLPEQERVLLRRLAIFRGSFTLIAASSVASDEEIDECTVVELLAKLISCSLVVANATAASTRYHLLETTRAYAMEKLVAAGQSEVLARRHAQYFRDRFYCAPDDWLRMRDADWDAMYLPERDNVRAALDWTLASGGDPELGIALAGGSDRRLWRASSYINEGRQKLESAVAQISTHTSAMIEARLWHRLAELTQYMSPQRAITAMERAVELYRPLGDTSKLGVSLLRLGTMLTMVERFQQAASLLDEALPLLERATLPKALAMHCQVLGRIRVRTGDLAGGRAQLERAVPLLRTAGAERGVLVALGELAEATWLSGDLDAAVAGFRELAAQSRSPRNIDWFVFSIISVAGVLTERGELDEALAVARQGLPSLKGTGESWMYLDHLALRAGLAGKLVNAAHLAGYADFNFTARKLPRRPTFTRARDRLQALFTQKLAPDELADLVECGCKISEDDACRIALED